MLVQLFVTRVVWSLEMVGSLLGLMLHEASRPRVASTYLVCGLPLGCFQPFTVESELKMSRVGVKWAGGVGEDCNRLFTLKFDSLPQFYFLKQLKALP